MKITEKLKRELNYVSLKYNFSGSCNKDMQNEMFKKGLVEYVEGVVMLTPLGEQAIGMNVKEIYGEDEEDITEAFFYMNEGEY